MANALLPIILQKFDQAIHLYKSASKIKSGSTGRIYGPIKLEKGYYYFQMMDKQPAGSHRSLDLVRDQIRFRLTQIKREKLAEELGEELRERFTIEVFREHIP